MNNTLNNEVKKSEEINSNDTAVVHSSPDNIENIQCPAHKKGSGKLASCLRSNHVPVNNPEKLPIISNLNSKVFSAFPTSEELVCLVIKETKGSFTTEGVYPIIDELYEPLKNEKALQSVTFYLTQMETGEIFFTYCKNGPLYGSPCNWFISKKACIEESMGKWLSMTTNKDEGIYESSVATEQPELPSGAPEFNEALELALEERIIDSLDHPILVANNIGQPKRSSSKATTRRIRVSSQIKKAN